MNSSFDQYQGQVPPKKKRPVFVWFFLAVQALYIYFVIRGIVEGSKPVDCGPLTAESCNNARALGTGIGIGATLLCWGVVDILMIAGWYVWRHRKPA